MDRISATLTTIRSLRQIPTELLAEMAGDARVEQAYERLNLSGRRDLVEWIEGGATPTERRGRARQAADMIRGQ